MQGWLGDSTKILMMREQGNRSGPNREGWMRHLEKGKANVQILNINDGVCQFTVYQLK